MTILVTLLALAGTPAYVDSIPSDEVFNSVARESRSRTDIIATTKFIAPATDDDSLLPVLFQNVNVYEFHLDFMTAEFPERFAGLDELEYRRLVELRATRQYFAGIVMRIETPTGETIYGFDFYTDLAETPTQDEARWVWERLQSRFAAGELLYAPLRSDVVREARSWQGLPFLVYIRDEGAAGNYFAYTTGTAYGRLRLYTTAELEDASEEGEIVWQDIVAVDEAPRDLTSPVSCVITGTPQAELSHLSLRLSQRGTPNAYAADYDELLADLDGELVRIDVLDGDLAVALVEDLAEAEAWWAENRPRLTPLPIFDLTEERLLPLDEIAELPDGIAKYGAKAFNLGLLRAILPPEHVVNGFGVPLAWYERFMTENQIFDPVRRDVLSYADYLARLEQDDRFRTDSVYRSQALEYFVDTADDFGEVPQTVVDQSIDAIVATFGDTGVKVRYRSSSNLEDIIPFNGAGLYESTSACAVDTIDGREEGLSACDPNQSVRPIERACRRVWSSIWLARAYNERDFWQVPQDRAKMGILVSPAFPDELANGVVLTGNPSVPGDDRVVINVQVGEEEVVSPNPGVLPEKIVVEVDGGVATRIDRVRPSTLSEPGEWILSPEQARAIGELAWRAADELGPRYETSLGDILFDLEFKIERPLEGQTERQILFKQVRPFLRESAEPAPDLALIVADDLAACGLFREFRAIETEYELRSTLRFVPGRIEFPGRAGSVPAELFEEILVGPDRVPLVSDGPGRLVCEVSPGRDRMNYRCAYEQDFTYGESTVSIELELPLLWTDAEGHGETEARIDEAFLSSVTEQFRASISGAVEDELLWSSCSYDRLGEFESHFLATTGEEATVRLHHRPPLAGTGPERIRRATLEIDGETRELSGYWDVVYAAIHHNWNRRYWLLLDDPIGEAHVFELNEPTRLPRGPASMRLLGSDFEVVRELELAEWSRQRIQNPDDGEFTRGDTNGDGFMDIADPIRLLDALFLAGEPLVCRDAGDADDDGRVNVTDAVRMLFHLFYPDTEEFMLPWPGAIECGKDLTEDLLGRCDYDLETCFERF